MSKFRTTFLVLVASLTVTTAAMADDSDDLTVHASVANSCVITGAALDFGVYDTITGAAVTQQADLTVACTQGTITAITLNEGANEGAGSLPTAPHRRMVDVAGTSFLSYSLYSDTLRQDEWTSVGVGYTALSSDPAAMTVYGQVEAGQDVVTGDYNDTVLATVTF
jgi:spore coat protein U-like protein